MGLSGRASGDVACKVGHVASSFVPPLRTEPPSMRWEGVGEGVALQSCSAGLLVALGCDLRQGSSVFPSYVRQGGWSRVFPSPRKVRL